MTNTLSGSVGIDQFLILMIELLLKFVTFFFLFLIYSGFFVINQFLTAVKLILDDPNDVYIFISKITLESDEGRAFVKMLHTIDF